MSTSEFCQVLLCKPCREHSTARCEVMECAVWWLQRGWGFGNEYTVLPLTLEQVNALDAAREFERGLQESRSTSL